jgi:hypothetical protein
VLGAAQAARSGAALLVPSPSDFFFLEVNQVEKILQRQREEGTLERTGHKLRPVMWACTEEGYFHCTDEVLTSDLTKCKISGDEPQANNGRTRLAAPQFNNLRSSR